jgi:hypothetical protein
MNMGEATDDVHECVRCLRAIMNHQSGFHKVIEHPDAINSIALSLKHKEFRYFLIFLFISSFLSVFFLLNFKNKIFSFGITGSCLFN